MQKIRYQYKYALLFLLTALTVGMIFSSEAFRSELDENYGLKFLTTFSSESIYKIDDRLKIIAFDDISFKNIRYDIMEPSRVEGDPPETGSVREELMQNASECKPDGLENLPFIDQNIYGSDLPLIRWAEFFCLLDKLKPSTIIIDRHWSNLIASKEDSDSFTKLTKNLNARLAIGAVPGDPETKKYFDKKDLVSVFGEQDRDPKVQKSGEIRDVFVVPEKQFLFTSVVHKIRDSFSYIGHILYDKPSRISPLLFDSKGGPVPHLAFSAQEIGVKEKSKIDPISKISEVPLDRNQRIPLLILQRDDLIKRTESLYWMRRYLSAKFATKKGKKHFKIKSGDVVLILPSAFSGGPDYRDSYEGRYPGGFLLASMINSVLTNRWITPINTSKVEYLAVLCFFAFVTLFLSPIQTLISALC